MKRQPATYVIHADEQTYPGLLYAQGQQLIRAVGGVREAQSAGVIYVCLGDKCTVVRGFAGYYKGNHMRASEPIVEELSYALTYLHREVDSDPRATPSRSGLVEIVVKQESSSDQA